MSVSSVNNSQSVTQSSEPASRGPAENTVKGSNGCDCLMIRKVDGEFYEVTLNGKTSRMTKDEIENTRFELGQGTDVVYVCPDARDLTLDVDIDGSEDATFGIEVPENAPPSSNTTEGAGANEGGAAATNSDKNVIHNQDGSTTKINSPNHYGGITQETTYPDGTVVWQHYGPSAKPGDPATLRETCAKKPDGTATISYFDEEGDKKSEDTRAANGELQTVTFFDKGTGKATERREIFPGTKDFIGDPCTAKVTVFGPDGTTAKGEVIFDPATHQPAKQVDFNQPEPGMSTVTLFKNGRPDSRQMIDHNQGGDQVRRDEKLNPNTGKVESAVNYDTGTGDVSGSGRETYKCTYKWSPDGSTYEETAVDSANPKHVIKTIVFPDGARREASVNENGKITGVKIFAPDGSLVSEYKYKVLVGRSDYNNQKQMDDKYWEGCDWAK